MNFMRSKEGEMLNSELISVTINQLDNMKHAIGYKRDSVKRGKYRSYRNYYASGATDESWPENESSCV